MLKSIQQLESRSDLWRDQRIRRARPKRRRWRCRSGRVGRPSGAALCQGWDGDAPVLSQPGGHASKSGKSESQWRFSWGFSAEMGVQVWKPTQDEVRWGQKQTKHNDNHGFVNLWALLVWSMLFTYWEGTSNQSRLTRRRQYLLGILFIIPNVQKNWSKGTPCNPGAKKAMVSYKSSLETSR